MFKFTTTLLLAAGVSAISLTASSPDIVEKELLDDIKEMHWTFDLDDNKAITVDEFAKALFTLLKYELLDQEFAGKIALMILFLHQEEVYGKTISYWKIKEDV